MISLKDYFGAKITSIEVTPQMLANCSSLLVKVNLLLKYAEQKGVYSAPIDPDTGTCISGSRGGAGDGGFRLSTSTTGAAKSQHKKAHAVDVYDPANMLDNWITDGVLEEFGLFRETPTKTPGWCHLQDVGPASGNRTYMI
jgi:hypothetical protein